MPPTALSPVDRSAPTAAGRVHRRARLMASCMLLLGFSLTACSSPTPMQAAAERGHIPSLDAMLRSGISPNEAGSGGRTPVHEAAKRGHETALAHLIEGGGRIDLGDDGGRTPLMLAVEESHEHVVELLLARGADPNAAEEHGITPLMQAARDGDLPIVQRLIAGGARVDARSHDRETALMMATKNRHLDVAELLLEHEAPVSLPDQQGRTPLQIAVDNRDAELVETLLEHGADVRDEGAEHRTPLITALRHRDDDLVALLLEHGADANARDDDETPALHIAVRGRMGKATELLLARKAEPDALDRDAETALMIALRGQDSANVERLLRAGAAPDVLTRDGQTALYISVSGHDYKSAKLLVEHGASPDRPNRNGARPMMVAVTGQDRAMVRLLLDAGATPIRAGEAFEDPVDFLSTYGVGSLIGAALAQASEATDTALSREGPARPEPPRTGPPAPVGEVPAEPPVAPEPERERDTGTSAGPARSSTSPSLYSKRIAVVIGIDRYAAWPSLEGARRDAIAVSDRLRELGFDEVIEVYDQDATRRRILTALGTELASRTDEGSLALIYFAGHGQTESLANGTQRGYIVPVDADPQQVFATAISMDTLRSISSRLPARQVYYAMDSCYSGLGFTRGITLPRKLNEDYVQKLTSLPAVQMITAGADGEQALESGGQGIFTRYLLRALSGEADYDRDGWTTASEIGNYVRPHVTNASNSRQTPRFGTIEGSGEIVFAVGSR